MVERKVYRMAEQTNEQTVIDVATGHPVQNVTPTVTGEVAPAPIIAAPAPVVEAPVTPHAGGEPTFAPITSQEDFERRLAERLDRERKKYADYADAKKKAAEYDKYVEAQKTEEQKRQERLEALERELTETRTRVRESAVRTAIVAEAARRELADPNDAQRLVDMAAISVAEDGTIKGVQEAIDALVKSKPYLLRRVVPATNAANPPREENASGRTDADRRREYFGGGGSTFWQGGGVTTTHPPITITGE